jgi:potassium uptake TrkH family protein
VVDFVFILFIILLALVKLEILDQIINYLLFLKLAVIFTFIREFSALKINYSKTLINPAQIFVASFLLIIIIGAGLLMLPKATTQAISAIDAVFTSTSAVCVTGLAVVDTGTTFTQLGQIIVLLLIQLGGLGIITFASYVSFFFQGKSSYENQLLLGDFTSTVKISEVYKNLKKIILATLLIELLGAIFIYFTLNTNLISSINERIFFSIFHSVSGFCNAGFSTLQNNLYEYDYRYNYPLHLIIAGLILVGGIGFPVILNLYIYSKFKIQSVFKGFINHENSKHLPWVINLNTRIIILTTIALNIFGAVLFFILEYNNTLAEHNIIGKIVGSIFGAITPRTAGYNTVDTSILYTPTILLTIFLMWVGASPASTGGGIKTSTFAIALFNFVSIAKGKERIEIYKREISENTIRKAFAMIMLSIIVISLSVFSISIFEKNTTILNIVFEVVSAFSTVGLSLGITAKLSMASKIVLILTMFIGRVSMLTLLIAFYKKVKSTNYRYPKEEILTN